MRKTFFLLMAMLAVTVSAQEAVTHETSGTLSVSKTVDLNPDGSIDEDEGFITIAFEDDEPVFYTAFQFDVMLPDGVSLAIPEGWDNGADINTAGGVYPKSGRNYSHACGSEKISGNGVRVIVYDGGLKNGAFKKHAGDLVDIYLKATAFAKPGDFNVTIKNIKFVTPDETGYVYAEQKNLNAGTIGTKASLDVRVTKANKVGTAIFPFDSEIPAGLEAYTCTGTEGDYLLLGKSQTLSAFTPYILYSENGFDGTITGTTDAANFPVEGFVNDGYLTGVLKTTEVSSGYILQNQDGTPKFYRIGATPYSLPAGRCYFNSESMSKTLIPAFSDATGIHGIEKATETAPAVFDLQGRRVSTPQSGRIYIINGEKVMKK